MVSDLHLVEVFFPLPPKREAVKQRVNISTDKLDGNKLIFIRAMKVKCTPCRGVLIFFLSHFPTLLFQEQRQEMSSPSMVRIGLHECVCVCVSFSYISWLLRRGSKKNTMLCARASQHDEARQRVGDMNQFNLDAG